MEIRTSFKPVVNTAVQNPGAGNGDQGATGPKDPDQKDTFQKSLIDSFVTSPDLSRRALSQLSSGGSLTITTIENGVKVTNEGPSLAQKVLDGGARLLQNSAQEVVRVMDADPAFAFKSTAEAVQTRVVANLDADTKKSIDPFILPVLRGGMLAMDSKRAIGTYRNKDASVWEKGVDIAHVATDVIGLAGAVGKNWIPFLAPYAGTMTGIGLVGDLAAVSFHAMGYLTERGQVNLESMDSIFSSKAAKRVAAQKAAEEKAKQPNA